ncbi:hypothetical protein ABW636_04955 [Aquimarina sp. 2201CG1-2-11]
MRNLEKNELIEVKGGSRVCSPNAVITDPREIRRILESGQPGQP